MPIITTKILGINEADPKPATGFNYAGEPMKPGDFYNGRPEHMGSNVSSVSESVEHAPKARKKRKGWTAAAREKASKAWWDRQARKASEQSGT